MTNITLDQLIADLAVSRGKSPETGGCFILDSHVSDGTFRLDFTDGKKLYCIEIEGAHEDGHDFDVAVTQI